MSEERRRRRRGLAIALARLERPTGMTTMLRCTYACSVDTIERLIAEGDRHLAEHAQAVEYAAQTPKGYTATPAAPTIPAIEDTEPRS
jgi:hypothetical protein